MNIQSQIAQQLRDVFYGNNWTCSNLKNAIDDINLVQANKKFENTNSIFKLLHHIYYYVPAQIDVLQGIPLLSSDAESFILPIINTETEWSDYKKHIFEAVEYLATLIEGINAETLLKTFVKDDFGNYYRNLTGLIEHTHYHLGQIVLLKKML